MRRIDVLAVGLGIFIAGGLAYLFLQGLGLDAQTAGIWAQVGLMGGLVGWLLSYLLRAFTQRMTYHRQLKDYQEAVLQKRLEALTPEELAQIRLEIEQENRTKALDES